MATQSTLINSNNANNPSNPNSPTPPVLDSLAAYEQVLAELAAVDDEELIPVNLDITLIASVVLGCLPEISRHREEILAHMPKFDVATFDKLELYARAAGHAHALHLRAAQGPDVSELVSEATALREILFIDATALARRGLIDGAVLAELRGPVGHRNLAFDLSALSSLLRENWVRLQGKTAVTPEEIGRARALYDQLITVVGLREQAPALVNEAARQRQRAFTLLVRAYDQARRALSYLHWSDEELDRIAPSLYERRGQKRKSTAAEPELNGKSATVPTLVTGTPELAAAVTAAKLAAKSTGKGLPGETPFVDG